MSHVELAAILRAKAWRNYPGVFTAPETRPFAGQKQSKQEWPAGEVLLTHVPIRLHGNPRLHCGFERKSNHDEAYRSLNAASTNRGKSAID